MAGRGAFSHLVKEVVDLVLCGTHLDLGVDEAGRADDLLNYLPRVLELVRPRRRRDEDHLFCFEQELIPHQRTVVQSARQPEAELDQGGLPAPVAVVHASYLGQGYVRLVDERDVIFGEVVQKRIRRGARRTSVEVAGVVLDARGVAELAHHLQIVLGALLEAVRFQDLALAFQFAQPPFELRLDVLDGGREPVFARDEVGRGVDGQDLVLAQDLTRQGVGFGHVLDLVPEEGDAVDRILVSGMHLKDVATYPEVAPVELEVVPGVLDLDEVPQNVVEVIEATLLQKDHLRTVFLGTSETVDGGDARHHDHVPAGEQRACRRVPQTVDVLVDLGVLLDKGVRARDVSLGLVVVVVADEVLDGVVGEELGELAGKLRGERLVVRDDERRTTGLLNNAGHSMGLPRTGDAEQGLRLHTRVQARCELLYGPRLVTCRLVLTVYPESVPRRILHTETSGSFSWVVKRRASGTYDPIILRPRAFSRSFRRRYDAKHGSVERTCRWIPAFYPGLCRRFLPYSSW